MLCATTDLCTFIELRRSYHAALQSAVLETDEKGTPTNADLSEESSVAIASDMLDRIVAGASGVQQTTQILSDAFKTATRSFLEQSLVRSPTLLLENWMIRQAGGPASGDNGPEFILVRRSEPNAANPFDVLANESSDQKTSPTATNGGKPILHAAIFCKWTLSANEGENIRSEAISLTIRNRKGRLPHIVVVTGEPSPTRLASLALGTGDIDCVYHFALHELLESVEEIGSDEAKELMSILTDGKRIKDISDLALDLAV
jgi:hypothetical protein